MAEFKLGRLRFVWKNQWVTGTTYFQDDVVAVGGKIYICVIGHTASESFYTDFEITPPKWNLVSDGQNWRGDWRNDTEYFVGDIAKYGSSLYIANERHTSGSNTGTENYVVTVRDDPSVSNGIFRIDGVAHPDLQMMRGWTYVWNQDDATNLFTGAGVARHPMVMSTTQDGTHNGGTIYTDGVSYFLDGAEVDDAAAYDAGFAAATTRQMRITVAEDAPDTLYYFCYHHAGMSSTASVEVISRGQTDDASKWDNFTDGLDWKGNWHEDFVYRLNDFVKYGGSSYVCIEEHQSVALGSGDGLETDILKWEAFNEGFDYKGDWATGTKYKINDIVKYGPTTWIATAYHTASADFETDIANWSKFSEGLVFENQWNIETEYQAGDIVRYGGNQYVSKTNHTGSIPPSSADDWDLFSEGLKFLGPWGDDSAGFEYEVGQVVSHGSWTYRCIQDHQNQEPPNALYWEKISEGLRWRGEWLDDQEYLQGDVARYGDNSYICIQQHISEGDDFSTETETDPGGGAENSRPDLDTSGTYWNIIAVGSEQGVLTTTGDLVYYSSVGPTRLPIGTNGQILTVSASGIPEWATLGTSDDVYYVAEHGVDAPAPEYGISIDRPFRTIRYATQQIERGTKVPSAARLLELNRRFIQREIVEWTDYQITNNNAPFTTAFEYDSTKCERDMGLLIDAFIWDLTHGGNVRSREAALKYVNEPGQFYILGQEAETVASIQYGLTLIENVLKQEAPDVNYQTTNGDNSTAIVEQYFETALGNQADLEYDSIISGGGATTLSTSTGAGSGGGY